MAIYFDHFITLKMIWFTKFWYVSYMCPKSNN